jgi:hypothetical protein
MSTIQTFVQRRSASLMLLLISGGYMMLLAELLITNHTQGPQLVGVIASSVGLLLTLIALFVSGKARNWVALFLLVLSVSGLLGAYQHNAALNAEPTALAATVNADSLTQPIADRLQAAPDAAGSGSERSAVPPLAPLSLAGFALMGAVATLSKRAA